MKISKVDVFQLEWDGESIPGAYDRPIGSGLGPLSAFVRIETEEGLFGLGEASPQLGGYTSLVIIAQNMAPFLIGRDVFDHSVLLDTLLHKCIRLGPHGATSGAIAALDMALWDIKGKALGQPVYQLLGGAWRKELPVYSSIGGNAARSVDEMLREVERRVERDQSRAVKIRFDGERTRVDADLKQDIDKAKALRKLLGDDFLLGFDANNGYSIGGAIRVGRVLEDLGYSWFEEPVQNYHNSAMGEVAQRLDITVSAGEQTYTFQGIKELIEAGVRMIQPDITKFGGITGLKECAALAHAHGVEFVPHQTQPTIAQCANLHVQATVMHLGKPMELADKWERGSVVFENPSQPVRGRLVVPDTPGLGLKFDQGEMSRRSHPVTV